MEKVVYFLGAGFSAPLGLPVMDNFLIKARDLFFKDPQKYSYFIDAEEEIDKLSPVKHYYRSDQFNIEEILSILEIDRQLKGGSPSEDLFVNLICDVIEHYTPEISNYQTDLPNNWEDFIFGENQRWRLYGSFVAELHNLFFHQRPKERSDLPEFQAPITVKRVSNPETYYSVVTLNYDQVLEKVCTHISKQRCFYKDENSTIRPEIWFETSESTHPSEDRKPILAKLHGSVNKKDIVPPTWRKGDNERVLAAWKLAFEALSEANHIRIIGYSLPLADSYVKYLLKSAVIHAENLKSIHVICRDPDGSVKRRYDEFIDFKYYAFFEADVIDYLTANHRQGRGVFKAGQGRSLTFKFLENAHQEFIDKLR